MSSMKLNFRFAVVSDLHIALPHTIWDAPYRFHLVEVSIPAFEQILAQLEADPPDFCCYRVIWYSMGSARIMSGWRIDWLNCLSQPTWSPEIMTWCVETAIYRVMSAARIGLR